MIPGTCPDDKLSTDLEMEIVETAASNLICHKEYEKACESHAINGEVLANTNYKDGMLYHEGRI